MKKAVIFLLGLFILFITFSSCGKRDTGQLVGVQDRPKWSGINPYGMVYIPSGFMVMGQDDDDLFRQFIKRSKSVSLSGFYMDDTEITNNEYRQFVYYVRDSVAHTILGNVDINDRGQEVIDWSYRIDWSDESLDEMFYQGDMMMGGKREMDTRKFVYPWTWIDLQKAAHQRDVERSTLVNRERTNIYPDTLVWVRDFAYSYNEPFTRNYFSHPAYDDYPVVGVNWNMASAFNHWRTQLWNSYSGNVVHTEDFRLPTEAEWEWAARGGHQRTSYPWGSYYMRNAKGCPLANFKPGRGNYGEDGGIITVKATAYFPNDYGLYNMAGNVAEWTNDAYFPFAYQTTHDLNPSITYYAKEGDPLAMRRKVVRGGSWKDIYYYLQNGTRDFEFQDTTKSYIGFRSVITYLGRSISDFN
jgi:gliding motility-associated lipoprotein GldK